MIVFTKNYATNKNYMQYAKMFDINELCFEGEEALKNSQFIQELLMPTNTMTDIMNPNRNYLWTRYVQQALYKNYPDTFLKQLLGLTNKGLPQVSVPGFEGIVDYATIDGNSISKIQDQILTSIVKYGSAGIKVVIPDDVMIATENPRLEVIEGRNIIDGYAIKNGNSEFYKWILIDISEKEGYIFNEENKQYTQQCIYKVLGVNSQGAYYEAKIYGSMWSQFNLNNPESSNPISIIYPIWRNSIDFVPFISVNSDDTEMKWKPSYIQNLISISLRAFQLDADLRIGLHQQSNGHLLVTGVPTDQLPTKPVEITLSDGTTQIIQKPSISTGLGQIHIYQNPDASEEFVTPSSNGIQMQIDQLQNLHSLAKEELLNLIDAGASSSGDALSLRLADKINSITNLVKNVGNGITKILEYVAVITGNDSDKTDYIPFLDFTAIKATDSTVETPTETVVETTSTLSGIIE